MVFHFRRFSRQTPYSKIKKYIISSIIFHCYFIFSVKNDRTYFQLVLCFGITITYVCFFVTIRPIFTNPLYFSNLKNLLVLSLQSNNYSLIHQEVLLYYLYNPYLFFIFKPGQIYYSCHRRRILSGNRRCILSQKSRIDGV